MKLHEVGKAMRAFNVPPENHLANAALVGELPLPLDEREARLIQRRISTVEEQLPAVEGRARELEAHFEERIQRQPPRNWESLRGQPPSDLVNARQFVKSLKNELQALRNTLAESARIADERRISEFEAMAGSLPVKVEGFRDLLAAKQELVDATIKFADALNGNLEDDLKGLFSIPNRFADVQAQAQWCRENGIAVKELPEIDLAQIDELAKAVKKILGRKPEMGKRNPKWRQIAAHQRAKNLDEEALVAEAR